jgi:hypothetical protein
MSRSFYICWQKPDPSRQPLLALIIVGIMYTFKFSNVSEWEHCRWKNSVSHVSKLHCKKSWRSSSTPASGDAGPIHTGVVSDIPEENFTINIKLFQQNFTFVELLRYKHIPHDELFRWWPSNLSKCFTNVELLRQRLIVSKLTPMGHEPSPYDSQSTTIPLRHARLEYRTEIINV